MASTTGVPITYGTGTARRTALVLASATLTVHGLLLLNDGVYWDGHLIYTYLYERNWAELSTMFREGGAPQTAVIHWLLGQSLHRVFIYKLTAFVAILVATLAIWRLGAESRRVTNGEAAWIAVLTMAYPGYRVAVELIETPSLICYGCFFLAAWIDYRALNRDRGRAVALHLLTGVLFVLSFTLPSMVPMFAGYVLFAMLTSQSRWLDRVTWVLVLIAATSIRWMLRPGGGHEGYNQVSLSVFSAITEFGWFLRYAIYDTTNRAIAGLIAQPLVALGALLAARATFAAPSACDETPRADLRTFGFSIVLFGLAVGPYAVVGKHPLLDGWTTRHALLVGLPFAMAIVAFSSMLERLWRPKPYVRQLVLTVVIVAFGASLVQSYLGWQARWVKDVSVLTNLARTPGAERYSIFLIDDRFPEGGEPSYRLYEWFSLFRRIWHDRPRAAVFGEPSVQDIEQALAPFHSGRYYLADLDLLGCEAKLEIRRGRYGPDDFTMALTYSYTRLFKPERLPDYLSQVTAITVRPRPFDRPDAHSASAGCSP